MKRLLPSRFELVVLAMLAVLAAILLIRLSNHDLAMAIAAFPVILTAMLMGARRGGPWTAVPQSGDRRAEAKESV